MSKFKISKCVQKLILTQQLKKSNIQVSKWHYECYIFWTDCHCSSALQKSCYWPPSCKDHKVRNLLDYWEYPNCKKAAFLSMQTQKLPSSSALTAENEKELYLHLVDETVQDHGLEYCNNNNNNVIYANMQKELSWQLPINLKYLPLEGLLLCVCLGICFLMAGKCFKIFPKWTFNHIPDTYIYLAIKNVLIGIK